MTKICPLKFNSNTLSIAGKICENQCKCEESKCELWINRMCSTENMTVEGGCAIRLKALTNSEGLIVV
jgi:hypothetical protein